MTKIKNATKRVLKCGKARVPNFIECFDEKLAEFRKSITPKRGKRYRKEKKDRSVTWSRMMQKLSLIHYRWVQKRLYHFVSYRKVVKLHELDLRFVSKLAYQVQHSRKSGNPLPHHAVMGFMGYYMAAFDYACRKHQVSYESGFKIWQYEFKRCGWVIENEISVVKVMTRLGARTPNYYPSSRPDMSPSLIKKLLGI
jgi:hypothetical protein